MGRTGSVRRLREPWIVKRFWKEGFFQRNTQSILLLRPLCKLGESNVLVTMSCRNGFWASLVCRTPKVSQVYICSWWTSWIMGRRAESCDFSSDAWVLIPPLWFWVMHLAPPSLGFLIWKGEIISPALLTLEGSWEDSVKLGVSKRSINFTSKFILSQ